MARKVARRRSSAAFCYDCRGSIRGSMVEHLSTDKHRATVARLSHDTDGPVVTDKQEALDAAHRRRRSQDGSPEDNAAAAARLAGLYGSVIVDDDPDAPDAHYIGAGHSLRCPRCGRVDWRTAKGRAWHIENRPGCAGYVMPERHEYVTIGG